MRQSQGEPKDESVSVLNTYVVALVQLVAQSKGRRGTLSYG